jgi:multicomponent Na+:H+ antiporter subunit E
MRVAWRGALFLALWVVLIGAGPADIAAGAFVAALAAWASAIVSPPGGGIRVAALPAYALRFLRQSAVAGWDVARRAFAPSLAVRPGFVDHRSALPAGAAREAFVSVTGLLPGTVAVAEEGDRVIYHALDTAQPVAAQLAAEERAFAPLVGARRGDD